MTISSRPVDHRITFTLLGGLWVVSDTGGTAERITDIGYVARDPAWGPEGRRLAFISVEGSRYALAILEAEATEPSSILETTHRISHPTWSPDGTRLAYLQHSDDGCEIRSTRLSMSAEVDSRLWASDVDCRSGPVWTSGGVVFAIRSTGEPESSSHLARMTTPGDEPEVLIQDGGDQWAPAAGAAGVILYLEDNRGEITLRRFPDDQVLATGLPPDAGRAAMATDSEMAAFLPAEGKLWRVDENGNREPIPFRAELTVLRPDFDRQVPNIRLTDTSEARGIFAPRISPDGQRVAFAAMGDIWMMPLDRSAPPHPIVTGPAEETMPAWAPTGDRLAYVSNEGGDFDLWLISLDGGERERLTSLPGDEREPAWDPLGERIAFSHFDNWTVDLFWIRSAGGEPQRLTEHDEWNWDLSPTWSPDGQRLAFLRRTSERSTPHVALARPEGGAQPPIPLDLEDVPITALAWSPSGQLIYRSGGKLRAAQLLGEGDARQVDLALGERRAFHPSVDAEGRHLLYLSTDGLRLRRLADGEDRRIEINLQVPGRAPPSHLLISDVRVIDGTGAGPRGPVDIRIEDGRIVEIRDAGSTTMEESSGRVIDGSGLTAFPGLIDMHTHLFHYGLRAYLGTGVTTVRDVGFESHLVASRWEGVRSGRLAGPRIIYSGEFLDGPGGPWMGNFVVTVTSPEQVRAEVARLASFGAGWIKTYVRMPPELRLTAIQSAHEHGLPTTQHEIFPALAYGADGKEHVRAGLRGDLRGLLRASEATVTSTLETGSGSFLYMRDHPEVWTRTDVTGLIPEYVRTSFRSAVDDADSARVAEMRERHVQRVAMAGRLREEGVRFALGTDPTNPFVLFGIGVHWELEHLVEAGYSPVEALHLATGAAADALGLGEELGTIAADKLADLVLVEGYPDRDVRDARRIRWIVLGGEPLSPEELHLDRLAAGSR